MPLPRLKIHCHSLSSIMTPPKEKGQLISVGAKSHVMEQAKQYVYGYKKSINTKELSKGLIVESECIKLLNEVLFEDFTKNTERKENDWLTGECDIDAAPYRIHDIKASFSIDTFPVVPKDGEDKGYEWQMRGYMMLYDRPEAEVDYCLVDTPAELWGFDDPSKHLVSHIEPMLRVTRVPYKRDLLSEKLIIQQATAAQDYFEEAIGMIMASHR